MGAMIYLGKGAVSSYTKTEDKWEYLKRRISDCCAKLHGQDIILKIIHRITGV